MIDITTQLRQRTVLDYVERHRKMNDSRPPELMTSGENAAYECADAIRNGTP